MTILGKMLVFLVLVLSLVWSGLVVNAFVTRTNWRAESAKAQAKAKEAADSANAMKDLLESEQLAAEDAKRSLREEVARLYEQVAQLNTARNDLNQQFLVGFQAKEKLGTEIGTLQANIDKLQKQVDNMEKLLAEKEKQVTDLTAAAGADRVAAQKAKIAADAQKDRADRLEAKVQQLAAENEQRKNNGGQLSPVGPGGVGAGAPPEGFRGRVLRRDGDLVVFEPGLDAGVQKDMRFKVIRLNGTGRYLGSVTVLLSDPKKAVGRFTPAPGTRPGPGDYPKGGDELLPQ
jgi:polyhydroxyalkanoate synthesis regulator phasin